MPNTMNFPFQSVAIIGAGLLGGSLGLALKQQGYGGRIIGIARSRATLDTALERGCIDEGTMDAADAVGRAELVVIATPVNTACQLLTNLADAIHPDAIITDVGSTKQSIVETAHRVLPNPGRFVGSHPMAGAETSGPGAARADLYAGKPVIVTPMDATDEKALGTIESLWCGLAMQVHRMAPAEHDRAVAAISHVPHAISVLLMQYAAASGALGVASTGLADMTRLAGGDVEMWADIFTDNQPAVLEAMDQWRVAEDAFRQLLATGDRDRLARWLADARERRQNWRPTRSGGDA